MTKAWFMDNENTDQRLDHHLNPKKFLTMEEVYQKTGLEYFKINPVNYNEDPVLIELRKKRNYIYEDDFETSESLVPDYKATLASFFREHLHAHEEIRLVVAGSGYSDVRDAEDNWIRIAVCAGDLLIFPPGMYHRFTLDTKDYIKAKLYFSDEYLRQPHYRPADELNCRKEYLDLQSAGFVQS